MTRLNTNSAGPRHIGADRRHNVPVHPRVQDRHEAGHPAPASRPRGSIAAAVLAIPALCLALGGLGAWLDAGAPPTGPGQDIAGGPGWPWQLIGVALSVLAVIVLWHDRRQTFGWLLAFSGLFWTLDGLSQSYVGAGLTATSAWPGMTFALWFLLRFTSYLTSVTAVMLLIFPTGRFLPGRWVIASRCAVVAMILSGLAFIVVPAEGDQAVDNLPAGVDADPTSLGFLVGHGPQVSSVGLALGIAGFFFSLLTVVVRYRRSRGLERDRMRWLLWSVVVIVAVVVATAAFSLPGGSYLGAVSAAVVPPAAMTIAIVRPTLVPIQDLLARTLVLAAVLVTLIAADAALLGLLTVVLADDLTRPQVVGVVLVVAILLYGPLRQCLSAAVRRMMLGERGNRYDAVAGLASTLESTDDSTEQLAAVARAVATAFGIGFVSVEVDRGHGERLVTTLGDRPAEVRVLPITWRSAPVGRLVLPARGLRSRLTRQDEELLGDLVRQAATAARTAQLAQEVQLSRERLVTAREEERRRIRRDLHDGFGPALSGIVFQLEAVRMTIERDPAAARAQVETVSGQVQDVVADVRRLVHDLRPPALDDRGLVGALRQQADHLGVPLEVRAPADLHLPAAVEVAAFRIAGEALTNVARHADATRARLTVETLPDQLVVEVGDDGRGIAADRRAGVGLASLRERAAELGGTTTITSPAGGGTVVRALLPLRTAP